MRKIIACAALLAVLCAGCAGRPMEGDVNRDRRVDGADVTLLLEYVTSRGGVEIDLEAADVNGDGEIDIFDVARLRLTVERGG